jgi:hypothetical protein
VRIGIITDSFTPLKNSGAIQIMDLALEFVRQDHQIVVITPSSEIKEPFLFENLDGVQVLRLKSPKIRNIGYSRRAIAELLMPFMMIHRLKRSPLIDEKLEGVITYAPSIFLGPISKYLRTRNKCKNYLIIRDLFPQWAVDVGLLSVSGLPYFFLKIIERYLYSTANIIGVQTPANLAYFNKDLVSSEVNLEVLQNWLAINNAKSCSIVIKDTKLKKRIIFVYAGNMGDAQGLSVFIELAERVRAQNNFGFLFVGGGNAIESLKQSAESRELDNILFFDEIEPEEIPTLYQQCDVGIISLDQRHKTHNIPGKFLSYMQSGLPVLAAINRGNDLEDIINSNNVGRVSTNHSVDGLENLVEDLVTNLLDESTKYRCKKLYKDRFSPKTAVAQILDGLV